MSRILVGLIISYVIVVAAAFTGGVMIRDGRTLAVHFGLGLFVTLFTCLVHCIVLTYFVITGKLIKQAVLRGHHGNDYIRRSQAAKGRVSLFGVLAMATALAGAATGAWANVGSGETLHRGPMHMIVELLAIGCNVLAFGLYYVHIHRNARLVDEVFARLSESREHRAAR